MSEQILSAVHGVTTMLFGIYCSAFFLGIKPIRKNILTMFLLFLGQGLLYVIDLALFGETLARKQDALSSKMFAGTEAEPHHH